MKARIVKWFLVVALLVVAAGGCALWLRVDAHVREAMQPINPLYVGYADIPEKTLGVQLEPFEIKGWDGQTVQACIVRRATDDAELTPRQLALLDKLAGVPLKNLGDIDYALVSVAWDHGIRSALPLAEELVAAGITCVLWEPRGKDSAREWCTHGLYESRDVPLLIDELERRSGKRNMLLVGVGRGFGAGLALQAAAAEPRLGAVVAEQPTASLSKTLKRARVSTPMRELVGMRMSQLTGLEPFDIAAVKSAAAIRREMPVLVVYDPAGDSTVEDALAIYTQLRLDDRRLITTRRADDAPDAATHTFIYAPDGGTREVQQRVEAELVPDADTIPVEVLRWLDEHVRTLQEQPAPAAISTTSPSY